MCSNISAMLSPSAFSAVIFIYPMFSSINLKVIAEGGDGDGYADVIVGTSSQDTATVFSGADST